VTGKYHRAEPGKHAIVYKEAEPQGWHRLFSITVAQIALAGIFLMAYGFGKMLQVVSVVNGSVLNLRLRKTRLTNGFKLRPRASSSGRRCWRACRCSCWWSR
jgi:hypothetical protein